jgi:23S rRNA pseudouridine2605 synthase
LTAAEARETLGRELTEAAVLRGLCELWQGLRISPVYGETGQPARWELLRARHRDALAKAGSTSQVTALSLLVSIYLQSVYAATSEQIEIFLSPLASRSRVREAVRGLSATRQIHSLSMDAETYYFLEDGLPEFAQAAPSIEAVEPPRRPVQPDRRVARPETRSPARDARKPHWQEGSAAGQPPFPAARHFAPAPSREKSPHGPSATGSRPYRAARPAPGVGRPTGSGGKPGPARPAAGGGWKTPPRAPGKPAAERPSVPARGNFPPRVGQGAEGMAREPGRTGGPARPGPQKRSQPWTGDKRKERPAPWVRAGAKPRSGPDSPPPFRAPGKPGADRPNRTGRTFERTFDRKPGGRPDRPDRPGGQRRDRPRPSGTVAGGPPGAAGTSGRTFGRPSVPGRSQPRRPDRPNRPDRPDRPDRPGGAPRSSRPDSRPPRPGSPRSGPPRSGPPRSGPPRSGPPRPGSPRSGEGQPARPPFRSSSRPGPSGPRAGASSGRPTGRPGGRPAGRPAGRPGGKPGGRPGKGPANFRGRKPTGKKPGA